ncbi:DUF1963 domain-containing protein [Planctomicrobium piriforme]|uniref:Uncharacterized protein YwqG n=1 Tax=Planctomicrobium piriforme TaxID=1576369 RepID=A0A1I3B790_9PLAN|nr:DUF1963 domain-containing protein [Planctomicrobium piriforme]SFH57839.1 Uncharacterized protein YwqG [Planctomicrobium piriforme]
MSSLEEYKLANTRKASILQVGGFRPTGHFLASHFGQTPVALPGEEWPVFQKRPMLCICQLNLTAAPFVPESLKDIALITFFVDAEMILREESNGGDWCLRAYKTLDKLTQLAAPNEAPKLQRGFECRWEVREDYPVYDDPDVVELDGFDSSDIHLDNVHCTKVGGYASNIQSEPWWSYRHHPAVPRYCFQIDGEDKVNLRWGDCGTVYLARGTAPGFEDDWFLDWQCY